MAHELHHPILKELGLNASEAIVYELLLEMGPRPAQDLVDPSGLGRGNLYNVLKSLVEKQLVIEETNKKTLYRVVDPEALRNLAQNRRRAADELVSQLEASLPSFKSQYRLITNKPTIRFFEGEDGIKEIHKEMLAASKPIFALVGPDAPSENLQTWFRKVYAPERVKRGISVSGVTSASANTEELLRNSAEELRTAVVLPASEYLFVGDVNVFGNTVALVDYRTDSLMGILIESEALATSLRSAIRAIMALKQFMPPASAKTQ